MRTVEWLEGRVRMIDQRQLPWALEQVEYQDYPGVAEAIQQMVVRGAPAIGAAGAFGMALAAIASPASSVEGLRADLATAAQALNAARPTAVNLSWATAKMLKIANGGDFAGVADLQQAIVAAAQRLADDDVNINRLMGGHGSQLIKNGDTILHHCNTGALATVDYGTALGAIRAAHEDGKKFRVLLTETRPRMQGARLSAWELDQLGIPFEIIPDTAAGYFMYKGEIKACFVGADRIAANGDVANKIGTYQLSVLAKENWIPFYVVAPTSTIDFNTPDGRAIPIEERDPAEVHSPYGHKLIPDHYPVRNPAFDLTPNENVTGIITEFGIIKPPFMDNLKKVRVAE
jgi:methylthioribose-1-phosphate isomerase